MVDEFPGQQYQSLYRRYRPQRFSEVKGQDHVVMALRNAVRDGRVAHAYLFSGPRGTGKTSTARILAKALNCLAPIDGEPDCTCPSCLDIARGASLDVHELDAASNNGVDAMRDLVARASLATPGKWKVYIVDEVHMLSTAASNALLKTLEEPPGHVVFVLATTDQQKVLPTIRSRTQHYEFHLFEPDVLEALLESIAADAHLEVPEGAIEAAVRRGHGSARDAVSALDQVAAAGVLDDDDRYVREIAGAIAERESAVALSSVAEAMAAGIDPGRLAEELVDQLRSVFLGAVAPGLIRHADAAAGPSLPPARCVRAMELLGTALVDMREAIDPRITLEVALVRLTDPEVDESPAALLERIDRLERKVSELSAQLSSVTPANLSVPPAVPSHSQRPGAQSPSGSVAQPLQAAPAAEDTSDQAEPISEGPAASAADRPALGAFRTGSASGAGGDTGPLATSELSRAEAGALAAVRPAAQAATGPPVTGAVATAERATRPAITHTASPTTSAVAAETAGPALPADAAGPLPTRDDLVTAWGDQVLTNLRPRVRAVYAVGRWLSMDDGTAVYALPNAAHVEHAELSRLDVATALSQHFGCRIDVRLATETEPNADPTGNGTGRSEATATTAPGGRSSVRSEQLTETPVRRPAPTVPAVTAAGDGADFDELEPDSDGGRHDSLSWAEARLMDAFPGAEEVT